MAIIVINLLKAGVFFAVFVFCLGISVDSDTSEDQSKYKFGYVASHQEGNTQTHLESRDGNLALGRYYVNLPDGNSQKSAVQHNTFIGSTFAPQFGKKIGKTTSSLPTQLPKLNYTPLPGGFYLTHESLDVARNTTEHPNYVKALTSQTFSTYKDDGEKYSEEVLQNKLNKQTFYPTSENTKNEIKQLHIQSTTPPIKSYTSIPMFSRKPDETNRFLQQPVSSLNNIGYSKQKSIEKTNFAEVDAQIISEVQKHAEQIIMKDLQKGQNAKNWRIQSNFSPAVPPLTTVTMQPIIVTDGGEIKINGLTSSTLAPEIKKLSKDFQSGSINAVRITEKNNNDQVLEDSGFLRVSLAPSLTSSNYISPSTQELIDNRLKLTSQNALLSNSSICSSDLCKNEKDVTYTAQTEEKVDQLDPVVSGSKSNKITFYPKNEISAERHYITTIDVQKGISLDVQQNEDGSIQLAENFPFNKIRPYQDQNQYNHPTPTPPASNEISVTPGIFTPDTNLNLLSTPSKPYILNAVTVAPGLFDVTSNQNFGVVQGFNDVLANPAQDRIENRPGYENQLIPPISSVSIVQNQASDDLKQVEKNIQDLRQQILSDIDAQHEEEQRKHGLVDEERRQYFENLRKVEALKNQHEIKYNLHVSPQAVVQTTAAPVHLEGKSSVEVVTQAQLGQQPQISYQTELKDFNNQIPVAYSNVHQTNPEAYSKQVVAYNPQDFQTLEGNKQLNLFTPQNVNLHPAVQQTVSNFAEKNSQQVNFLNNPQQLVSAYGGSVPQIFSGYTTNSIQQTVAPYDDNNIQQTAPVYATQKIEPNNIPQVPAEALQPRFTASAVTQNEEKSSQIQPLGILPGQINTIPVSVVASPLENKSPDVAKSVLVNSLPQLDYSKLLQGSLIQAYPISLQAQSPVPVPAIYQVPQTVAIPVQIPQTYRLATYADVPIVRNKQYHSTLTQKPPNKLRVQPLKPSVPDEESQREAVQNIFAQSQLYRTYYYHPGLYNNRLQLRHIRKNQISNSDQVQAQSLTRREKSLKNLRIEYGFKPPLRPSVEFSEEVKPSIYGSSVQPQ